MVASHAEDLNGSTPSWLPRVVALEEAKNENDGFVFETRTALLMLEKNQAARHEELKLLVQKATDAAVTAQDIALVLGAEFRSYKTYAKLDDKDLGAVIRDVADLRAWQSENETTHQALERLEKQQRKSDSALLLLERKVVDTVDDSQAAIAQTAEEAAKRVAERDKLERLEKENAELRRTAEKKEDVAIAHRHAYTLLGWNKATAALAFVFITLCGFVIYLLLHPAPFAPH